VFATQQYKSPPKKVFVKEYPSEESFNYEGYKVNYYKLENTNKPKAIFIHFHGYCSHGGVTGYYADVIARHNSEVNVYAFDQLNFGKSKGSCQGLITSLQDSVAQGEAFVDHLVSQFETKPKVFLSGSSYGGAVILKMAVINKLKYSGLIFLSPALRDLKNSRFWMKKIGRLISWIIPRAHFSFELSTKDITRFNCD
jgi:alpha-beta hydrolase superfamily lysophospholipase